jgi:hypothetical protein
MLRPKEHQETLDGILGGSRIGLDVAVKTNSTPIGNKIPIIQFVANRFTDCSTPVHERVSVFGNLIHIYKKGKLVPLQA